MSISDLNSLNRFASCSDRPEKERYSISEITEAATKSASDNNVDNSALPLNNCMMAFVSSRKRLPFISKNPLFFHGIASPLKFPREFRKIVPSPLFFFNGNHDNTIDKMTELRRYFQGNPSSGRSCCSFNYWCHSSTSCERFVALIVYEGVNVNLDDGLTCRQDIMGQEQTQASFPPQRMAEKDGPRKPEAASDSRKMR